MSDRSAISDKFVVLGVLILLLTMSQCGTKSQSKYGLPNDLLGISIGMKKEEAETHLKAIAEFERDERKRQQVWRLKNDPRFNKLAVGYDEKNLVRYVTTFVDAASAKERIRFSDVGDISKAKAEIVVPHYRYIWDVPSIDGRPSYFVNIYGDNPELVTTYSLSSKTGVQDNQEAD